MITKLFQVRKKVIKPIIAFLLTFFMMSILPSSANPVSEDSARVKAQKIFSQVFKANGKRAAESNVAAKLTCVKRGETTQGEASYYIFNKEEAPGFAIIAGDDSMPAVIGYSLENSIDVDNMPDVLKDWLTEYDRYVKDVRNNMVSLPSKKANATEVGTPVIGPYLKTQWNQHAPYNWMTPVDKETGKHTPTGCVCTAAAQILNYYKWPENSYTRKYNWELIRDSYDDGYSDAEGMAVATLMRDLGRIMGTNYKSGGSATVDYGPDLIPGYSCSGVPFSELQETLRQGPIFASSNTPTTTLHSYVIDGLDSNGLYHVNFGWGGSSDGYYDFKSGFGGNRSFYLLKPKYNTPVVALAAYGGVSTESQTAKAGEKVTLTLHELRPFGGNNFNGEIWLDIYYVDQYNRGLYGTKLKNPNTISLVTWNSNSSSSDVDLDIILWDLPEEGEYMIVPSYYGDEFSSFWQRNQMFQFADGTFPEYIPFEYKNGEFIFKVAPSNDFDVKVSQLVFASEYREVGRSNVFAFIENAGNNDFSGTLTAKMVNTGNANDVKNVDMDLYIAANQTKRVTLNTSFDYTGSYSIQDLEVWNTLRTGERKSYFKKTMEGNKTTILPKDDNALEVNMNSLLRLKVLWDSRNRRYYVNDSIYKYESISADFDAWVRDNDNNIATDIEIWALPLEGGSPHIVHKSSWQVNNERNWRSISGKTTNLPFGSYRLVAFTRYGNETIVMGQPEIIGKGYSGLNDFITDNVVHIFDPQVDVPLLKLNSFRPTGQFYYYKYNYAEVEMENISDVDFLGNGTLSVNLPMFLNCAPFRIKAGQKAVIYPRLNMTTDKYIGENLTGNFSCTINNGIRDLSIPVDGTFNTIFEDIPEKKFLSSSGIAFYYKSNLSNKPSVGFYSKGNLKRVLFQDGNVVYSFPDLQTDSTYRTYDVCPEGSEIKNLPTGSYLLQCSLTDDKGYEWAPVAIPIIIDEEELPVSIESVDFDRDCSFSYDDEIPVLVTIKNPTQEVISTLLATSICKKVENENSWYNDTQELHEITLPPMQSTQIKVNAHVISSSNIYRQDGTFKISVRPCKTKRESGHIDFGSRKESESINLPYVSTGISSISKRETQPPVAYYSIDGKQVSRPSTGIYIVKYSDGVIRKKFFK